tara:strand:+ start:3819 stop:4472 length:654 start_codon:yes stop_codon:yes gene_type:complete
MQFLLTDDEIAALAASTNRAWPLPLLTVPAHASALKAAAFRGLRSLVVRGFATPLDREETTIAPELLRLMVRAGGAACVRIAHVSRLTDANIAGASVAVFEDESGALVDTANAMGIHAIEECRVADSLPLVSDFVSTRFDPDEAAHLSSGLCILVANSRDSRVARVRPGLIEIGVVETHPAMAPEFVAQEETGDIDVVDGIIRGGTGPSSQLTAQHG